MFLLMAREYWNMDTPQLSATQLDEVVSMSTEAAKAVVPAEYRRGANENAMAFAASC